MARRHVAEPDDREGILRTAGAEHARRPVLLATLSVRVDPSAEEMAIGSALEAGAPLVLVNAIRMPYHPCSLTLGGPGIATLPHEEDLDAVRATARRVASFGIPVELLRVTSRRPIKAVLEVARERRAALIVFGPDRTRIRPRRFDAAARRVRKQADCLVWVAPSG
jgi:nucleotide-binding universal stress UspA family protein